MALLVPVFSFLFVAPAFAQATIPPGCDRRVHTAMQEYSQARMADKVGGTEEMTDKPDSKLPMTCYNNVASTSAVQGGKIFSNPTGSGFIPNLTPLITDALTAFYDDFDDAVGFLSGRVDYTATGLSATAPTDCNGVQDMWSEHTAEGIQKSDLPYVVLSDFLSTVIPGGASANSDFGKNWQKAQQKLQVFSNFRNAYNQITQTIIPGFSRSNTSCQAMVTLGLASGPCP